MNDLLNLSSEATTQKGSTSNKPILEVNEKNQKKIDRYKAIKSEMAALKGELEMLDFDLKDTFDKKWRKLYKQKGMNPGTLLFGNRENKLQYQRKDAYPKLDQSTYTSLGESHPSLIDSKTEFKLTNLAITKYAKVIANFIKKSNKIEDDDRSSLFSNVTSYGFKKGVINNIPSDKVDEVISITQPTAALKAL